MDADTRTTGRDGRLYPAARLSQAELRRIRGLEHGIHCRDGASVRGTQQALEAYGIRRSLGAIWHDLTSWTCGLARCPSVPIEQPITQPAARQERPAATVRKWGAA